MEKQDRYIPWDFRKGEWYILDTKTGRKHSTTSYISEASTQFMCDQLNSQEKEQTFTREEVLQIVQEAYKAGHKECNEHWSFNEGGKVLSYEEFYEDYYSFPELYKEPDLGDKIPQIDNWIKENLK